MVNRLATPLPQSVLDRYYAEHPEEQQHTAAKDVPAYDDGLESGHREHWAPGDRAHFEYHCLEGHDSDDAEIWYRSHRPVTVDKRNVDDEQANGVEGLSFGERAGEGAPATYQVHWEDGHQHTVFEDELLTHPRHYTRPDPPAPQHIGALTQHMAGKPRSFYVTKGGGKYHEALPITGQAKCNATVLVDTDSMPIVVQPGQERIHPVICKRCLPR